MYSKQIFIASIITRTQYYLYGYFHISLNKVDSS